MGSVVEVVSVEKMFGFASGELFVHCILSNVWFVERVFRCCSEFFRGGDFSDGEIFGEDFMQDGEVGGVVFIFSIIVGKLRGKS
jgi:hypothetical protein